MVTLLNWTISLIPHSLWDTVLWLTVTSDLWGGLNKYHIAEATQTQIAHYTVVSCKSHNSVYDLATKAHFQEYRSDILVLLARYVGQVGIVSLTKIPLFTYLNVEQDKVINRPGSDIKADVKVWRRGGKGARAAEGFALMDGQLLATSVEPGGKQTATAAPLPLICAWVIRNTWLPIMAPVLSWEVEQGCEGRVHTNTQPRGDKYTANTSFYMPVHCNHIQ